MTCVKDIEPQRSIIRLESVLLLYSGKLLSVDERLQRGCPMNMTEIAVYAVGAAVFGYISFLSVLIILPKRLKSENQRQLRRVLGEAEKQAKLIMHDSIERAAAQLQDAREDLEADLQDRATDLKAAEEELDQEEAAVAREQSRVDKRGNEIASITGKVEIVRSEAQAVEGQISEQRQQLVQELGRISQIDPIKYAHGRAADLIAERQIEAQRLLKMLEEEINSSAKKTATRVLLRAQARYAPNFAWPKAINHVELKSEATIERLSMDSTTVFSDLQAVADQVQIEIVRTQNPETPAIIKLAGGFGVHREAARLALEELMLQPGLWGKAQLVFEKHRNEIEAQALKLGQRAMKELKLNNVHPQLMRMVGHLNWRTSYRQNQYLHTLEVAKLAGLLAHELGENVDLAKRSGLFHDIGKTIDYRIEGSHAVISGDYADRFGEPRVVCDTAMSHHNDLQLETTLSYILKTADTLSGARPGARVNLEEGYNIRLSAIDEVVRSFRGIQKIEIMNGGREVHVQVSPEKVGENELPDLSSQIARQIEANVAFPGQIKVMVTRRFEAVAVA